MVKIKRNDPCPCGSGKKYKKCHRVIEWEEEKEKRINLINKIRRVQKEQQEELEYELAAIELGTQHKEMEN